MNVRAQASKWLAEAKASRVCLRAELRVGIEGALEHWVSWHRHEVEQARALRPFLEPLP